MYAEYYYNRLICWCGSFSTAAVLEWFGPSCQTILALAAALVPPSAGLGSDQPVPRSQWGGAAGDIRGFGDPKVPDSQL